MALQRLQHSYLMSSRILTFSDTAPDPDITSFEAGNITCDFFNSFMGVSHGKHLLGPFMCLLNFPHVVFC